MRTTTLVAGVAYLVDLGAVVLEVLGEHLHQLAHPVNPVVLAVEVPVDGRDPDDVFGEVGDEHLEGTCPTLSEDPPDQVDPLLRHGREIIGRVGLGSQP
jgi:hypothetical protein